MQRNSKIIINYINMLILLIFCFIPITLNNMQLFNIDIYSLQHTTNLTYSTVFNSNKLKFAYFIEDGSIFNPEFLLNYNMLNFNFTSSNMQIQFNVQGKSNIFDIGELLRARIIITDYIQTQFMLGIIKISPGAIISLKLPAIKQHYHMQLKFFILNFPMSYNLQYNNTHVRLQHLRTPVNITTIIFSYIGVTANFVTVIPFMFISKLTHTTIGYMFTIYNQAMINPQESNTLMGLAKYNTTNLANNRMDFQKMIDYDFWDPSLVYRTIWIGIDLDSGNPNQLQITAFMFGPKYCSSNQFIAYRTQFYYGSPDYCQLCHITCLTCSANPNKYNFSDPYTCRTCGDKKYLQIYYPQLKLGKCLCFPGLIEDQVTFQCSLCETRCLSFMVDFIVSSTGGGFVLVFTHLIDNLIPIQSNLQIFMNNNIMPVDYLIEQKRSGVYLIYLDDSILSQCTIQCSIRFFFSHPESILKQNSYQGIYQVQKTVQISDYFMVQKRLPYNLRQMFGYSSLLIAGAMSGGASSMFKVLFELQQTIEFHKYLNLQIPLIFKQFIQSLNGFKFLDITVFLPQQMNDYLFSLSDNDFDIKGNVKAIYYQYGASFYKNIIVVSTSVVIIFLFNIIMFFILRLIPLRICWQFSQKLRIRRIMTITDLIDTMILPVIVFTHFQLSQIIYGERFIMSYLLMSMLNVIVLIFPFFVIVVVYRNRKDPVTLDIYEDLMQDCVINNKITYIFFVFTYYRKIIFGLALNSKFNGRLQVIIVLVTNILYMFMLIYIIMKKLFISKVKMLAKLINILSMITIQLIIIYYDYQMTALYLRMDLGLTCVYLAIFATITCIFQTLIKIVEFLVKSIKQNGVVKINAENTFDLNDQNSQQKLDSRVKQSIKINKAHKQQNKLTNIIKNNQNIPEYTLPQFLREYNNIHPQNSHDSLLQDTINKSNKKLTKSNKKSVGLFNKFFNRKNQQQEQNKNNNNNNNSNTNNNNNNNNKNNNSSLQIKYQNSSHKNQSVQSFTDIIDDQIDYQKVHHVNQNKVNRLLKKNSQNQKKNINNINIQQNQKKNGLFIRKTNSLQITKQSQQKQQKDKNLQNNKNIKNSVVINKSLDIDQQIKKAQQRLRQKISKSKVSKLQSLHKKNQQIDDNLGQKILKKKITSKTHDQTQRMKNIQQDKEQINKINGKQTKRKKIDKYKKYSK